MSISFMLSQCLRSHICKTFPEKLVEAGLTIVSLPSITGANRGIGLALVQQLATKTDSLIYATVRSVEGAENLKSLVAEHLGIRIVQLDMNDQKSVDALPSQIPGAIDVLILNAAIIGGKSPILSSSLGEVSELFETNVVGSLCVLQKLAPKVQQSTHEQWRVIFISSTAASMTLHQGDPTYCISKAGEQMVGRLAADELKESGVTVILIHPGWVQTDMGGKNAHITPTESATKMLEVALRIPFAQSGSFWNYRGEELPF